MSVQHIIAHFDLDSFFVSVEVLKDPSLKGKPVIVGGNSKRGIVAACSYEARKYGIHSAMPSAKAFQLCPHAISIRGSYSDYSRYSRWVTQIIADKAPLFEKASVDEFYLDLTGMDKYFDPLQWTIDLRQKIIDETKLPISFGLASNKMIAKMATDEAKPNGYLHIPFGKEKEFLAPLPVNKIPGVGKQTFEVLKAMGIKTISDIQKFSKEELEERLGKWGIELWNKSLGIHKGKVTSFHEAKSISTESTYMDNATDISFLMSEVVRMSERIAYELRQDEKVAGCVAVKIRYPDFETTSRQTTISYTCADDEIIPVAKELFHKLYKKGMPVRLLGVRLSELTGDSVQTNLFNDVERKVDLYKAIDDVKKRFGKVKLKRASSN
ncbi:DNA polymerase IV [Ferruginibacter albus]|uniref:DNA polymerase IV n=1 Tax=Ferruginibacter albus TaxID=2875540 RepID=UPI001CC62212|nr:DNA polymerase IV [Ferruginibacter albus]UAY51602.1 DNA polymerase IV [Ferruginibacter albus]